MDYLGLDVNNDHPFYDATPAYLKNQKKFKAMLAQIKAIMVV